jgi:hypothetical protein
MFTRTRLGSDSRRHRMTGRPDALDLHAGWNNPSLPPFLDERNRRFPVPSSLQYPLERHRELQRRWNRLLQRTAAPKEGHPNQRLLHARDESPLNMAITEAVQKAEHGCRTAEV